MALAIFDLDETLIHGDCSALWCAQMARLGWVDEAFLRRDAQMQEAYGKGHLRMEEYMAFSLEPIAGRTLEEIEHLVQPWVEEVIEPIIFGDACRCIAEHRRNGDRVLIISASGAHLVGPIAQRLGVEEFLAIDLETANGVYTGNTRGELSYREGKVTRLMAWLDQEQENLEGASFYSDSRNDLPLLLRVDHPRAVNPDAVLREHAQTNGWPILDWV
nr:HAD family hydrolase [uncultured Pseudomonas sp.]